MSEPYTETVRDMLIHSYFDEKPDRFLNAPPTKELSMSVIPLKSDNYDFSDYLIRTSALYNPDHFGALDSYIAFNDTGMSITKPLFVGPKTSQSLMTLSSEGKQIKRDDHFALAEIVPKHAGTTMEKFLNQPSEPGEQSQKVARYFLEHPDTLTFLFEQTAFIGLQKHVLPMADLHMSNYMVETNDAGDITDISLIDLVSSEEPAANKHHFQFDPRKEYEHDESLSKQQKQALRYIDPDVQYSLYSGLSRFARGEHKEAFGALLKEAHAATQEKILGDSLTQDHPHWKGFTGAKKIPQTVAAYVNAECERKGDAPAFQEVSGNMVMPITAPAYALKLALDALYAKAVPEQGAAR